MDILQFIPKDNQEIPDFYKMSVIYLNGKQEEFDVVSHSFIAQSSMMEILTRDDEWKLIQLRSIYRIDFDKSFSKLVDLKKKQIREATHVN